jgi:hypothetical protein
MNILDGLDQEKESEKHSKLRATFAVLPKSKDGDNAVFDEVQIQLRCVRAMVELDWLSSRVVKLGVNNFAPTFNVSLVDVEVAAACQKLYRATPEISARS